MAGSGGGAQGGEDNPYKLSVREAYFMNHGLNFGYIYGRSDAGRPQEVQAGDVMDDRHPLQREAAGLEKAWVRQQELKEQAEKAEREKRELEEQMQRLQQQLAQNQQQRQRLQQQQPPAAGGEDWLDRFPRTGGVR